MKVLEVNKLYHPWIGGVEEIVRQIAVGLHGREGVEVQVLACMPRGLGKEEIVEGIKVWRASSLGMVLGMPLSLDFFRLFRRLAREHDVILLHHPFPLGFLAYFLFGKGKPAIVWYHSDIVRQKVTGFLLAPLIRAVLRRARKIFVTGSNMTRHSAMLRAFPAGIVELPYGVDIGHFRRIPAVEKEVLRIRGQYATPLILTVGRMVYYKGFEYLVRAMRNVPAALLIVGNGPLRDELSRLSAREGVMGRVHFIDPVPDLLPYYCAADIFVLPSIAVSEAFGIVQIEAMACGVPVVNTALPTTVPEVSVDEETGYTVPPRNSEALAGALRKLVNDPGTRQEMGERARRRARDRFSLENFLASHIREFRDCLK